VTRRSYVTFFSEYFKAQFGIASNLNRHEKTGHSVEYEKSISSHLPLLNEISEPKPQLVL
jgi:hypothetical protein